MIIDPKLLIVTPAHNEAEKIMDLARSLQNQINFNSFNWLVVADSCTDRTLEVLEEVKNEMKLEFTTFDSSGRLISGGAFKAWRFGVENGLIRYPETTHIMKLDADVNLSQDYFFELFKNANSESAILGGVLTGISREQQDYVPGPVKMYSIEGFIAISSLPSAPGFDVMDEVLCEFKQLAVTVVKSARFSLNRPIGHSQGKLHGRYRNGRICRWTGYAPEYFALHFLRYIFRKPYVFGSLFMLFGFISSNSGPYSKSLRSYHSRIQRQRLKRVLRHPVRELTELYLH